MRLPEIVLIVPLLIIFSSDWVKSDDVDDEPDNRVRRTIGECGGNFYGQTGTFTSPNYPSYYDNFDDCTYTIQVSSGYVITLLFTVFQTEECCDTVTIYDGWSSSYNQLGMYSGTNLPPSTTSSGNTLSVYFQSDVTSTHYGFLASYYASDSSSNILGYCGGTFTSNTAAFSSPNYPGEYYANADCYYYISVSYGYTIELSFNAFRTEACCDEVSVYDGSSLSSSLIGTYSGSSTPSAITSSGSDMAVYFHSDISVTYSGFYATYSVQSTSGFSVCSTDYITSIGGTLHSHDSYPSDYPSLTSCSVTIETFNIYDHIYLEFTDVDLYNVNVYGCYGGDTITISNYDGELGTLCETSDVGTSYTSTSSITITFTSYAHLGDYNGFEAIFSLYYESIDGLDGCTYSGDFVCNNYRCVPYSLTCDGTDNCGDFSDENYCWDYDDGTAGAVIGVIVGSIIGIIIFIIIISVACYCCCKKSSATAPARTTVINNVVAPPQQPTVTYAYDAVNIAPGTQQQPSTVSYGYPGGSMPYSQPPPPMYGGYNPPPPPPTYGMSQQMDPVYPPIDPAYPPPTYPSAPMS